MYQLRYDAAMEKRLVVVLLLLGLAGWLGLVAIQWQFGLGRFAKSPQEVVLRPGGRAIVGGGRAVLGFVAESGAKVTIEVRCAAETARVDLDRDTFSEPLCGLRVRRLVEPFLRPIHSGSARFEVTWRD